MPEASRNSSSCRSSTILAASPDSARRISRSTLPITDRSISPCRLTRSSPPVRSRRTTKPSEPCSIVPSFPCGIHVLRLAALHIATRGPLGLRMTREKADFAPSGGRHGGGSADHMALRVQRANGEHGGGAAQVELRLARALASGRPPRQRAGALAREELPPGDIRRPVPAGIERDHAVALRNEDRLGPGRRAPREAIGAVGAVVRRQAAVEDEPATRVEL